MCYLLHMRKFILHSFLADSDFVINIVNSLDLDQVRHNIGPDLDLDLNCLTL